MTALVLQSYSIRDFGGALRRQGLELVQHPIIECAAPDDPLATADLVEEIVERLGRGQVLAIHCR